MTSNKIENNKIIKSFLVVGLNETKIQRYSNSDNDIIPRFIQNIDILITNLDFKIDRNDTLKNEKWLKIYKNPNSWLRFQYKEDYINPITDLRIQECDYYKEYLLIPKKLYDDGYRPVKILKFKINSNNIKDFPKIAQEERSLPKLDKDYIIAPIEYDTKYYLNLPNNKKAVILLICRKTLFLPLREVILQKKQGEKNYRFGIFRHKSPYIYKYLPEILDSYPDKESQNQAVSLFCFPEGIQIKDKSESLKCFNFVLTDEFGERMYGSTLIFSQEISISLREAFIPTYDDPTKTFYIQKALCVLSKYPFYYNCLLFLKELYNIVESKYNNKLPIERIICSFVDSLYIQTYDKILRFYINDKYLDFYRIPNYGKLWDTNDKYLETLFRVLSYEQIITAWKALLLEKKLFLICSSKAVLSQVAHALINLLFPFKWIHVYVPILPEKLKLFIESPVPLIIGISFHIDLNEIPNDSLILNLNKNCFENNAEKLPPLPNKLNKILMNNLMKLKKEYDLDNPQYIEKWFNHQDDAMLYLSDELSLFPKINISEVRDAFYMFFLGMFKNYEKYFEWNKKDIIGTENMFKKDNFLKDHNSTEENSFCSLFSETTLFSQFIDSFGVDENKVKSSFAYFLESIKKGKGKNKYYLSNIIPKNVIFSSKIEINDLNDKVFTYSEFPNLKNSLYIKHEPPKIQSKSRFVYLMDEWCYSTDKFKRKDWPKYFLFLIYDIWFTFFSFVLNIYDDNQAIIMMDYALRLLEHLIDNLKICPTRNLFSKIIKSCTRPALNPFIKQILIMVKDANKGQSKYNSLFHNDYLNGLYFLTENVGQSILGASLNNSLLLINTMRTSVINEMKKTDSNIELELNKIIFMTYNICQNCLKLKKVTNISFDEILSGFIMRKNEENYSICPNCLCIFEPKIFYFDKEQDDLDLKEINLYNPMLLIKKIDEIIKNYGELYFYKENDWNELYWNIIFYFQLLDLPTCVLYVQNNISKFEKLKNILKENIKRKFQKEKKSHKKGVLFFLGKLNKTNNDTSFDSNIDNSRYGNYSNNISDISINSVRTGISSYSNYEMDLWKNYQLKKQKNDRLKDINSNVNSGEDKNEILLRVKETKSFLLDSIYYFYNNSQEKLRIFLDKYEQLENSRQHDYVNMCLKKENEKYEINNNKEKKESKMNEDLRQTKFIPQNSEYSKSKEEIKNVIIPENRKIEESSSIKEIEKDNNDSLNTRFDFKITQKVRKEILNNNSNNNSNTNFEKIPLDNKRNKILFNENNIINKNNEMNKNIKIQSFDNLNNQNYNKQFNNNVKTDNIIVKNMNIINNNNKNNIINMNQNANRITNITINKRIMTPKDKINQNNNNKIVNYKNRMMNNNNIYKIPQPKDTIIGKPNDPKNIKNISFDNKNSNNNFLKEQNYIAPQDFQKIKTYKNNNMNLKQGFQVYKIPSYRSIFDDNSNI